MQQPRALGPGRDNESSVNRKLIGPGQAVSAALAHQNATAHQRSREATRCTFAAVGQGSKTREPSPPSSCCSAIARPLGTGLKLRHTFLRALPQPIGLDVPPLGGR